MRMDKQDTLGTKTPHLMAPTIDHVVPISIAKQMGWTSIMIHKESNLQSAHLICNIRKSNNAMNEQLRIW
jgi:pentose-5-phosphate-3-epimerase